MKKLLSIFLSLTLLFTMALSTGATAYATEADSSKITVKSFDVKQIKSVKSETVYDLFKNETFEFTVYYSNGESSKTTVFDMRAGDVDFVMGFLTDKYSTHMQCSHEDYPKDEKVQNGCVIRFKINDKLQKTLTVHDHSYKPATTKATPTADGKIVNACTVCKKVSSTTVIPKASSIKLSATSYTYDGKVKTPSVTVKDRKGKVLVKNTDYTISYASGRKNVGKYSVKITFKGKYSGTKTLYFTIKPRGTSIAKLTATSKGFKVTWKKQATQTTGYQIQYSTSSKFTNAKTVTVKGTGTTSKSISRLTAKKRYYVRVRTYKTVGKTNYYSSWSSAKYVTTKK